MRLFHDRIEAGKGLARELSDYGELEDVIVLGLARGGLPVAKQVAEELNAPLDVFLVRKLGVPGHEELAMGAIASGGIRVLNEEVVSSLGIDRDTIGRVADKEQEELERREQKYRGSRSRIPLEGKLAILVDDGIATGASMRAAVKALRVQNPKQIIVAVPTSAPETCAEFEDLVDEVICVHTPSPFYSVGAWYEKFPQVNDEQVRRILQETRASQ